MSDEFEKLNADELQATAGAMLDRAKELIEQERQNRLGELYA